jgi:dTDP-4-amino-4,6-dideoxygalactose transaminase
MHPSSEYIPFNRPFVTGREFSNIATAIANAHISSSGPFSAECSEWLEQRLGAARVLLTHSCTAALEMAMVLADLERGDEVIMPSFTFVSTANAVVLRGAIPVFVEIRPDTLNLDENHVEAAITERTKAIVPVHYAGVACAMEPILELAEERLLLVVEDAAQALLSYEGERPLGGIGEFAALSFHETKNVTSGEGGALVVRREGDAERAEIILEKGTNRCNFLRGQIDKYTWIDIGSSYAMSEISAAFLWAQLLEADEITARRLRIWERYHEALADAEREGRLRRPIVPAGCRHNAHMYYLLLPSRRERDAFIEALTGREVNAIFHFVPLHSSPAGSRFGRSHGDLSVTADVSDRLVRLPLWAGMVDEEIDRVIEATLAAVRLVPA